MLELAALEGREAVFAGRMGAAFAEWAFGRLEFAEQIEFLRQKRGKPTIASDTGSNFVATESVERANDVGAAMEYAPVKCAELRGADERLFGTFGRVLMPRLPGRTFSNPKECGDYDSRANACLDDDDLIRILICYIVDEYVNGGVKLGHWAAQNWAILGFRGTRVMGGGQSAALSI